MVFEEGRRRGQKKKKGVEERTNPDNRPPLSAGEVEGQMKRERER